MALEGLAGAGHPPEAADHQISPGGPGGADQPLGSGGGQVVVPVHKLEVLPRSPLQSGIAGGGYPGVGLVEHVKAGVGGGPGVTEGGAGVGGAVIHQPHLQVLPRLGGNGVQAVVQIGLRVVDRHDNADEGLLHSSRSFRPGRQ